jgi:GNAT superfamily N-acetyltransferase
MPKLTFREVDNSNWHDFEELFAARGGPKSCWCMVWRSTKVEAKATDGKSRKAAIHSRVRDGVPIGLLGYLAGEPVAWCSIAPRTTYRPLGGPDDFGAAPSAVWSLACFFIRRDLRGKGASEQALNAAIAHARRKGGKVVEAYPVDPDSPSYRFMGFVGLFERAGFKTIGRAGIRRYIMRLPLDRSRQSKPQPG